MKNSKNESLANCVPDIVKQRDEIISQKNDKLLTRYETANLFKVTCVTLYNWDKKGLLTAKRMGGRVYYSYNDILNKLNESVN